MKSLELYQKISSKPAILVILPILYCMVLIFAKWGIKLPLSALWFLIGGLIGTYGITIAEHIANLSPSPFRTQIFALGVGIIAFYTVSSTREYLAMGASLLLMLNVFLYQISEWKIRGNLNTWYQFFFDKVPSTMQKVGLFMFGLTFFVVSVLFLAL